MAAPGRNYFVTAEYAVASPSKTMLTIISATTVRPGIYDIFLGSSASPADNALLWTLQRFTAAGTAIASVAPQALDPGDPSSQATSGQQLSAEPTYTASALLFRVALNQRATHRAVLDPRGPILMPATAANGAGLLAANSTFTGNADAMMYFFE